MFRLEALVYNKKFQWSDERCCIFDKSIIYYHVHKEDKRPFLVTFILVNFTEKKIIYIKTYSDKNKCTVNDQKNNEIYAMQRYIHCTLSVNRNTDFLVFMEEEKFFFYVNYKDGYVDVYTMNDLVKDKNIDFGRISSTFYKDPDDPDYFYMSAVALDNRLYLYRVSLDLKEVIPVDNFLSNQWPPHVLRKYKNNLFISHEFKYSMYQNKTTGKMITPQELKYIILKKYAQYQEENNWEGKILYDLKYNNKIVCAQGKILMVNLKNLNRKYYKTSGGSPAHFEIDEKDDILYTSSHNFIVDEDTMVFYEPAVIDKFKIKEDSLEHVAKFSFPKGYRYTTHKVFYHNNKAYICTVAEPNRLIFISTESMELVYSYDIGQNVLDKQDDIMIYINGKNKIFSFVALEISDDGETILFLDSKYLYLFSFSERRIYAKIDYTLYNKKEIDFNDYLIRTVHFNFLD